ncbi:uroporphyrinogen-III C-methyltransferase [Corynebacterium sp. CNCTC7651]|uniref:uroporphyrinogen-III C-methyltransferase n=1 Tax=Corynebacterium sp. CNCTC7651 TaxID=2815361 RepID=UPI001F2F63D2|nr:uroporphyrinogen-III C-methyltransferase [Corynebacterium sp. CNCTC7651]UIZ91477.1 uroporphyrinogen-III C-methyltransferase [Corynebacterium sp. CNCTC7651]
MQTVSASETGHVTLVGGGPGEWDLLTIRGLRALEAADVILTDHLGPADQLAQFVDLDGKVIIDVAKLPYGKQVAQERINELLVQHALAGKRVARLKGGDPHVFGRGFEEYVACAAAGVPCTVVPGVTSAISVPSAVGVPVTQRGVNHCFTVVSGHLPPGHAKSLVDWAALGRLGGTIIVVMGVKNVGAITRTLIDEGLDPTTPATAIQDGETAKQRAVAGTVATLADEMERAGITNPAVYVIGEVAAHARG